jgi:hypothetical protein
MPVAVQVEVRAASVTVGDHPATESDPDAAADTCLTVRCS